MGTNLFRCVALQTGRNISQYMCTVDMSVINIC